MEVACNFNYYWALFPVFTKAGSAGVIRIPNTSSGTIQEYFVHNESKDLYSPELIDLYDLIDHRFKLKKPIQVKITRDELDTIGEINELGIYAFGNSQFEVLREINKDVTELFEELFNISENQLGKLPRKWKETLLEYVEKEDE